MKDKVFNKSTMCEYCHEEEATGLRMCKPICVKCWKSLRSNQNRKPKYYPKNRFIEVAIILFIVSITMNSVLAFSISDNLRLFNNQEIEKIQTRSSTIEKIEIQKPIVQQSNNEIREIDKVDSYLFLFFVGSCFLILLLIVIYLIRKSGGGYGQF